MSRAGILVALALVAAVPACGGSGKHAGTGPKPGGPAAHARLDAPEAVAVDRSGNLYVAELGGRVVKITPLGRLIVIAGKGGKGYAGDGGRAVTAKLNDPTGLAFDGKGNLAIADWGNNVIRKVDSAGIITTILKDDKLANPVGLAYNDGVLYVADTGDASILRVDGSGSFTAVAKGVHAAYLGFDDLGNLDFTDYQTNTVSQILAKNLTATTTAVTVRIAGTGVAGPGGDGGPATAAQLSTPYGLAITSDGDLYISEQKSERVRKIDSDGIITTIAGTGTAGFSGDSGPATRSKLNTPVGLAVDSAGNLYIADKHNNRVRRVDAANGTIGTVAGGGS